MIAVDSNILVYAHRRDSEWHQPARDCVRRLAEGTSPWMIPWPCFHEFLAIVSHPRIYNPPTRMAAAIQQVEYWLASPSLTTGGESPQHWPTLRDLVQKSRVSGPLIHDARVAAICRDHAVEALWSADRDFSRFAGLKVHNPLTRS